MNLKKRIKSIIAYAKFNKLDLPKNVEIDYSANILCSHFEGLNRVGAKSVVYNSVLGYGSYIGSKSSLIGTKVGRYCSLGPDISMPTGGHPTRLFASTSPLFYSVAGQCGTPFVARQKYDEYRFAEDGFGRVVGNDVWIGGNVVILEGVRIGDGAVVGAGSVVAKDVPPYSVCTGVPAKPVRYRFDEDRIAELLRLKWWERDPGWVRAHAEEFEDVDLLIRALKMTSNKTGGPSAWKSDWGDSKNCTSEQ